MREVPLLIGEWRKLNYWHSGEWQVIREKLDEVEHNPRDTDLFAGLRAVPPSACKVVILGQDPYPDIEYCTGLAFSTPRGLTKLPPSVKNILSELQADLGIAPNPICGDLSRWCEQGILLWNVYPTCAPGKPGSHHWDEWTYLTREIVEKLDGQVVYITLGQVANNFVDRVTKSPIIHTSHPSPLGVGRGFRGSRIFSRCNLALASLGHSPIDWRLDDGSDQEAKTEESPPT